MIELTEAEMAAIEYIEEAVKKPRPLLRLVPAMHEETIVSALLKYRRALEALAAQVVAEQSG